ncbi:YncE family protein [Paenibacillus piscarius]|uniref:YncE family protein n=1 Tax=Paenibacillus piscarius TaxID=1089681 RepID=UPI001EE8B274|nr:YncE family protein [Paenibacillus piscarius]
MHTNKANQCNQIRDDLFPYVYALYTTGFKGGAVAVIDPAQDRIINRLQIGLNPTAMCIDPSGKKLYVTDESMKRVFIYNTDDFVAFASIRVGTSSSPEPIAVFVEPSGRKAYIANYGDRNVTIIDAVNFRFIANVDMDAVDENNLGQPFAFASSKDGASVYVACKRDNARDYVVVLDVNDDGVFPLDPEEVYPEPVFDKRYNPLAVHPNGHTLVSLANVGVLDYVALNKIAYKSTSLLDNTVSGVYLDNQLLFCTMREGRNFLKVFKNLAIDANGNITYQNFKEVPSYKGQELIRTSRTQKYIGVTVHPTDYPTGGLQIIDVDSLSSKLVELYIVGDMTIFSDSKAYVGEINAVRPIDLATATALPAIDIGGNDIIVKKIISGYSNQSS